MSFIVAAPSSGSGKTTITLGILRALTNRGVSVRAAKSGPDYIDPRFHAAACHQECFNLDAWAMSEARIKHLASGEMPLIIEGAMGLFDGAPPIGKGATADLARILALPVVLVVDASRMAQSIVPIVNGFANHDPTVKVAGVILNKVGSERHAQMLKTALSITDIPILGCVMRDPGLTQPSRHLGLVQAREHPDLDAFLNSAAATVEKAVDLNQLVKLGSTKIPHSPCPSNDPPAQRIAIAQDDAFAFAYPHLLADWRAGGAEISFFSPLADEAVPDTDFVFLPGGYPENYAGQLAANDTFISSLTKHADSKPVYGECGGYMMLGDALTDAGGVTHKMAGLLRLETNFAQRKLHLGYRRLHSTYGYLKGDWLGHEFHYATTVSVRGTALFKAADAADMALAPMGLVEGNVSGSFAHVIDRS